MIIQQMIHVGQIIEIYVIKFFMYIKYNVCYINFNNHILFPAMTINAVTSMQIPNQLEGKQKAVDLFIIFLKEHDLWNRVSYFIMKL